MKPGDHHCVVAPATATFREHGNPSCADKIKPRGGVRTGRTHEDGPVEARDHASRAAHPANSFPLRLNADWRVVDDSLQWIPEHRKGKQRKKASGWRARFFFRTRSGLVALVGEHCGFVDEAALAQLKVLAERHP